MQITDTKALEAQLHETLQGIFGKLPDEAIGNFLVINSGTRHFKTFTIFAEAQLYCQGLLDGSSDRTSTLFIVHTLPESTAAEAFTGKLIELTPLNSDIKALYRPGFLEEQATKSAEQHAEYVRTAEATHDFHKFIAKCVIALVIIAGLMAFLHR